MHRSRLLFQLSRFSSDTADVFKTARRVERIRARRLEEAKSTVNPYIKAQYITAFIEARSASLTHKHFTDEQFENALKHADDAALHMMSLKVPRQYEEVDSKGVNVPLPSDPVLSDTWSGTSLLKAPVCSFGDWRETPLRLRRHTRSIDIMMHCVIREARTPPELSIEALERALPLRTESMQRFMKYLESLALRYREKPNAKKVDGELLFQRYEKLLQGLGISYNKNSRKRSAQFGAQFWSSVQVLNVLEKNLASYLIQQLTLSLDWNVALDFLKRLIARWTDICVRPNLREDLSQQVAVFAEAVRYSDPGLSLPSIYVVEGLLQSCTNALAGKSSASSKLMSLSPVVAAPILSILDVNVSDSEKASIHDLQRLLETYLIQYRRSKKTQLQYLPAIAWGEYLRALARFGASLEKIQIITDTITDSSLTWSADELLRNSHVWAGYLSGCDAKHALSVYESNRDYYHVKETVALSAVLIERHLVSPCTDVELSKASALWASLQSKKHSLIIGSSSLWVAVFRLYLAKQQHLNLMKLSVDYDIFLAYFGVDRKWWENEGGLELFNNADNTFRKYGTSSFQSFFERVCCTYKFRIPPAVQHAFQKAFEHVATSIMAGSPSIDVMMLSANDLADAMDEAS